MNASAMLWTGRILIGLFALFMLGASITPKLLQMPVAEETMAQLGCPPAMPSRSASSSWLASCFI